MIWLVIGGQFTSLPRLRNPKPEHLVLQGMPSAGIYQGSRRRQHRARMAVLWAALGVLAVLAVRGVVILWQWLAQ
jgi:hypothetical protein